MAKNYIYNYRCALEIKIVNLEEKMKNWKKKGLYLLAVAVMAAMLFTLTACGDGGGSAGRAPVPVPTPAPAPAPTPAPTPVTEVQVEDEDGPQAEDDTTIVGTWADDYDFQYMFFEDGTGIRGGYALGIPVGIEEFSWTLNEATGRLDMYFPAILEEWSFAIEGDALVIVSRQVPDMAFAYVWLEQASFMGNLLPGVWSWNDDPSFLYGFDVGGSGIRGSGDALEEFYWSLVEFLDENVGIGHLYIEPVGSGEVEWWSFSIENDNLIISSRQVQGMTFAYTRVEPVEISPGHSLLGIWNWFYGDMLLGYEYLFYGDGSGIRGPGGMLNQNFYWLADEASGELYIVIEERVEEWSVSIEDGVLTFTSVQDPGLSLRYSRVD